MRYLPLCFDLKDKPCLLVGGGGIALRKARLLASAGARLHVVAPEISAELATLVTQTNGVLHREPYQQQLLDGVELVVAATNDLVLNREVSQHAKQRQLPVSVVDQPELCTFVFPAIIDRSPLVIAVSSGGTSPVLARILRSRIESFVPSAYGKLAEMAGQFRVEVKKRVPGIDGRRRFWEKVLEGPVPEMVFSGKMTAARKLLQKAIEENAKTDYSIGEVYLVGAGPGDPDLLTFRALRLMQQADIVLYDRLVAKEIIELCRRDAEFLYVGKQRSDHVVPQDEINQLLVDYAKQGKRVLRLKGGDPFIFGRGGEEIELLAEANIPFQVVPGITAASGCACYSGIPLTHRDYSQSVRFVTGHLKEGTANLNWKELVQPDQTLVFYMGLKGLPVICEKLIEFGLPAKTPIAIVQDGTTARQRVIVSNLADMPKEIERQKVKAPSLTIVGQVVLLHEKLAWYFPDQP